MRYTVGREYTKIGNICEKTSDRTKHLRGVLVGGGQISNRTDVSSDDYAGSLDCESVKKQDVLVEYLSEGGETVICHHRASCKPV